MDYISDIAPQGSELPEAVYSVINRYLKHRGESIVPASVIRNADKAIYLVELVKSNASRVVAVEVAEDGYADIVDLNTPLMSYIVRKVAEFADEEHEFSELQAEYKAEVEKAATTALEEETQLEVVEDTPDMQELSLIGVYHLADYDLAHAFKVQIEQGEVNPYFALFFRVPENHLGFKNSKIVAIFWDEDLTSLTLEEAANKVQFALSGSSTIRSKFTSFNANPLIVANLTKSIMEGPVDISGATALMVDKLPTDAHPDKIALTARNMNMHLLFNGQFLSQPLARVYGVTNISGPIAESSLASLDRFQKRSLINLTIQLVNRNQTDSKTVAELDIALEAKNREAISSDISEYIEFINSRFNRALFTPSSPVPDIGRSILELCLNSGAEIVYDEDSSGLGKFNVDGLNVKLTVENVQYKLKLKKDEDGISMEVSETEVRISAEPTKRTNLFSRFVKRSNPQEDHVYAEEVITDTFEQYLSIVKMLQGTNELPENVYASVCTAHNLKLIRAGTPGIYVTDLNAADLKPTKITVVGADKQEYLLIRNNLPKIGEVWSYTVKSETKNVHETKIVLYPQDIAGINSSHFRSVNPALLEKVVKNISDPKNPTFTTPAKEA